MSSSIPSRPRASAWLVPASVLTVLAFALAVGLSQDRKPGKEQEEANAPVIKKKLPDEEDEPPEPKSKVPTPVGEKEPEKKGPAGERRAAKPSDLGALAEETRIGDLKQFYFTFSVPHDVFVKPAGGTSYVEPIPQYLGPRPNFQKPLKVRPLDKVTFKRKIPITFSRDEVESVEHYEQLAVRKVDELLAQKTLPRATALKASEQVLGVVLAWHESARESGDREGERWDGIGRELKAKLRDVKLYELREMPLRDEGESDKAAAFGQELLQLYPDDPKVQEEVANIQFERARKSADQNEFRAARTALERLESQAPNSPRVKEISRKLEAEATKLRNQARAAVQRKDRAEAKTLLNKAIEIWPRLPGLLDELNELNDTYPILYVGVGQLPENVWPGTARLDSERQAVELLFESMIRPNHDPDLGLTYEPGLASDRPRIIPLGRQIDLVRDARWSDGSQVTAMDVRRTLELIKTNAWPGFRPECKDLVDEIRVGSDPFQVNVQLRQGYLDPLSLMDFKVLPAAEVVNVDAPKMKPIPVGSGPYVLEDLKAKAGVNNRPEIVFKANPSYRGGKADLPRIREIHFVRSPNPESEFKTGQLHLLLNIPTEYLKRLQDNGELTGLVKCETLQNRRIYFLAINHRRPALGGADHADLRRALNHAIDREGILNKIFRSGTKFHRQLTGPYPPGSWACDPKIGSQFDEPRAGVQAQAIDPVELSLKYPDDDRRVEQACQYMKESLERLKKVKIRLEPLPPRELYRKVELEHDYDLAYYHFDYPTEDYWLWPLLDPRTDNMKAGAPNFLGFNDLSGRLQQLFHEAMARREFKVVQELTRKVHAHLFDLSSGEVPFVPLWQLDTHIAYRTDLKPVALDPLLVFTHVEEWRLVRER